MTPLEKNIMKPRRRMNDNRSNDPYEEKVIEVSRVSRTVKGGRRIRFRALVVVGDRKGKVGMGLGKANEVTEAVSKANTRARKALVTVPIIDGTIPHEITGNFGAAKVLLKPASSGTSIVAGGSVRVVAELAGITDLLAKSLGSRSKVNNVAATIEAFKGFSPRIVAQVKAYSDKRVEKEVATEKAQEAAKVETATPEVPETVSEKKVEEKTEKKMPEEAKSAK